MAAGHVAGVPVQVLADGARTLLFPTTGHPVGCGVYVVSVCVWVCVGVRVFTAYVIVCVRV